MENSPGIKNLTQINALAKLFNDVIKIKNYNAAYNFIYKMRIIHGLLLVESNKNIDTTDENLFNLSCFQSILYVINEKIIESEILFQKIISENKVDISKLKIIKSDDSLPLFNGQKQTNVIINDEIKNISGDMFNESIPSLLLFYNPQCPACVQTKPHWDDLINDIKQIFKNDKVLFNIMEINLADAQNEKLARLFKIEYIPTIIMMESSNRQNAIIERLQGASNKNKISLFINEAFGKFMNN